MTNSADKFSRKQIDKLIDYAKKQGAKGLVWFKFLNNALEGPIVKFLSEDEINNIVERASLTENDILFMAAGETEPTLTVLGHCVYIWENF